MGELLVSSKGGELRIRSSLTPIKVQGLDPTGISVVIREFWDPEGTTYEAEHLATGTKADGWSRTQAFQKLREAIESPDREF